MTHLASYVYSSIDDNCSMIQIRVIFGTKIFCDFSGALTNFSGSELSVITSLSAFSRTQGQVALRIIFLFDFIIIYAQKKQYFARDRRQENKNCKFCLAEESTEATALIQIIVRVVKRIIVEYKVICVFRVINHLSLGGMTN